MKYVMTAVAGAIGGMAASAFGGWSAAMTTLLIFMAIDYFSGIIVAGLFHKSKKTDSGGLSSKAGFRGIAKKCMILLLVLIGARIDITLGVAYVKDAVCIAFVVNELISIIENAGLMGIPVPDAISKAIDMLVHGKNGGDGAASGSI